MNKKIFAIVGVILILCSAATLAQKEATIQKSAISSAISKETASASSRVQQAIQSGNWNMQAGSIWKRLPDLTVTQVLPGSPSFEGSSIANVPLTVTIKNLGASTKERFKISVDVQVDDNPRFVRPFTVPGQDIWYPWQTGLASGAEATFTGNLLIGTPSGESLSGKTAKITAMVDSISGDEFISASGSVI